MEATPSDQILIERTAEGDQRAFAMLVSRHLGRAHAVARRMLPSRPDAEDAIQEAFRKLWMHAAEYDASKASFGTWFYRILTHCCVDHLRRTKDQPMEDGEDAATWADTAPLPDALAEENQQSQRVQRAVQSLPANQRMAVILCYFDEMTNPEAAAAMGLHLKALEGLLVRARKKLREILT